MMGGDGWMSFGGGFMWIFWLILIVILVVFIKAITGGQSTQDPSQETPLDILEKRFARGEIDEQEYRRKRKELDI